MLELRLADIPSVGTTDNELQFDWCIFKCVFKIILWTYITSSLVFAQPNGPVEGVNFLKLPKRVRMKFRAPCEIINRGPHPRISQIQRLSAVELLLNPTLRTIQRMPVELAQGIPKGKRRGICSFFEGRKKQRQPSIFKDQKENKLQKSQHRHGKDKTLMQRIKSITRHTDLLNKVRKAGIDQYLSYLHYIHYL